MRPCILTLVGLSSAALLASQLVSAQASMTTPTTPKQPAAPTKPAPAPVPRTATLPRAADGHPALQGIYDVATMTPLERLAGVNSLVLTKEQAAAMEAYEAQRQVKNDAPLSADRGAPPVGGEATTPKSYLEFLERAGGGAVG